MKAVVCTDFNESSVEEVPRPDPDPGEVLIEVDRVQLSVTECQMYRGHDLGDVDRVHEIMTEGDGRVFGHEFCGRVAERGEGVSAFEVGDRVYAPAKISCGECAYCEAGYTQQCKDKETIGMGRPGALAEYVALPTEPLWDLPDAVPDAEGAAMQPLASAVLCVHDAEISTGDVVVVVGCGVMGYQAAQLALVEGAREVYAVDVDPKKLEIARERGLTPINARETDPIEEVKRRTDGVGADVVVEAVGGDQSTAVEGTEPLAQCIQMARSDGTLLQVGLLIGEMDIAPGDLRGKSIDWVHPRFGVASTGPNTDTGELAPSLVADGRVTVDEYITHELNGLQSFEEAVEITLNKEAHEALGPPQMVL